MGKFILDIPEDLHDQLRHKSVDEKIDMKELLVEGITNIIAKPHGLKGAKIPSGDSTIVFQVRFWNPAYYTDRKAEYEGKKNRYNFYDGVIRLQSEKWLEHFHSPAEMMRIMEDWYKKFVDSRLKR